MFLLLFMRKGKVTDRTLKGKETLYLVLPSSQVHAREPAREGVRERKALSYSQVQSTACAALHCPSSGQLGNSAFPENCPRKATKGLHCMLTKTEGRNLLLRGAF